VTAVVNLNGRIADEAHAVISIFDHGFLYGEGIYETLRTYYGEPFLFDRHMRRLRKSAGMLALPVPWVNDEIERRVRDTMLAAALDGSANKEAYIRIMVTRGVGDLSYDLDACPSPSIVVIVKPQMDLAPDVYDRGVAVVIVSTVRNHPGTVNPAIKSNNLLNNALAMQEAVKRGGFEGVMRNYRGELAECTTSNLFVVKDGVALTPPLASGLLPGITREFLFEVAAERGIPAREAVLRDDDLFGADEAFLTSTTRELVPVVRVDERPVGSGAPGPVTHGLLAAFRAKARELAHTRRPELKR
jgi:branched-chain amino acid aminotransferase